LRDLNKEAYELKDLKEQVDNFQDSWIQPIKQNSNLHFTFLDNLEPEIKHEINTNSSSAFTFFKICFATLYT
jgi:hypothetical protein